MLLFWLPNIFKYVCFVPNDFQHNYYANRQHAANGYFTQNQHLLCVVHIHTLLQKSNKVLCAKSSSNDPNNRNLCVLNWRTSQCIVKKLHFLLFSFIWYLQLLPVLRSAVKPPYGHPHSAVKYEYRANNCIWKANIVGQFTQNTLGCCGVAGGDLWRKHMQHWGAHNPLFSTIYVNVPLVFVRAQPKQSIRFGSLGKGQLIIDNTKRMIITDKYILHASLFSHPIQSACR